MRTSLITLCAEALICDQDGLRSTLLLWQASRETVLEETIAYASSVKKGGRAAGIEHSPLFPSRAAPQAATGPHSHV